MDVREYSEKVKSQLSDVENESIQDVISCQDEIAQLYSELSTSNKILFNLEKTLTHFQTDLGNISTEIKSLQEQSQSMSISLKNRQKLDSKLGNYLNQIVLSPSLIDSICNKEIDEEYINYVNELREKLAFFKTEGRLMTEEGEINAVSIQEVFPEIRRLNTKAAGKIRLFILGLIQSLSKPKVNFQVIQETKLLKFKNLLLYLRENSPESFIEVCMNYNETLSSLYLNHFKIYSTSMKKMIKEDSAKNDLICFEYMDPKATYVAGFDLKGRENLLDRLETIDPIISHVAKKENKKFYFEEVFHSLTRILADTCSFNFLFVIDFFSIRADQYQPVFGEIFAKTYQYLIEAIASVIATSFDILALILILRINSAFQTILEGRGLFSMNLYFEKIRIVVWPRLLSLLDANCKEMENQKYLRTHDVTVHPVTKRFTQFILSLHKISPNDDMFRGKFFLLKKSFVGMLDKMALSINDNKNRMAFKVINLDYFLEVFQDANVALIGEFAHLETDFNSFVEDFIEIQLHEVFGEIMTFKLEENDQKNVEVMLHDFNSNWRRRLTHAIILW